MSLAKTLFIEVVPLKDVKIVHETLSRIGIVNRANELFQTAHLVSVQNRFHVIHFKEAYSLDSFRQNGEIQNDKILMGDEDYNRRNRIIQCLVEWKLVTAPANQIETDGPAKFFIVPFQRKHEFHLNQKVKIKA